MQPTTTNTFNSIEIAAIDYFSLENLPPLSIHRVTEAQIALCFKHYYHSDLPTAYD